MCVSIHLECWLDKARVEIVTWAAVGVASTVIQLQFGFKILLIRTQLMWIQFTFGVHRVNVNFQTESSVKRP